MGLTLTNHGLYTISGASLKTKVDTITLTGSTVSGAGLYFIPVSNGQQVWLVEVDA